MFYVTLNMERTFFNQEKEYFFKMGVAKAAGVESDEISVMYPDLNSSELAVNISAEDTVSAAVVAAALTPRHVKSCLQRFGIDADEVSLPVLANFTSKDRNDYLVSMLTTSRSWSSNSTSQNNSSGQCMLSTCPKMISHTLSYCPQNSSIGQLVTFHVQHVGGDITLFSLLPQIDAQGTLKYHLYDFRSGKVNFTATLVDDGGTEFSGVDRSTVPFVINILPLNSKPNFDVKASIKVIENGMLPRTPERKWSEAGFAFNINPGGLGEEAQKLTFTIPTQVEGQVGLFESVVISPDGVLHLKLAKDAHGRARFSVILVDDGSAGIDDSGWQRSLQNDNTSDPMFFEIVVMQVSWCLLFNTPPVFCLPALIEVNEAIPVVDGVLQPPAWIPLAPDDMSWTGVNGGLCASYALGGANWNKCLEQSACAPCTSTCASECGLVVGEKGLFNNPPYFCLPSSLHLVEGVRKQVEAWIPVSVGASTTNCYDTNFNAHDQERHQTVTFSVYADGNLLNNENSKGLGCAPFDYDYDFAQQVELSWFRIHANGSIDVLAINSGNATVTITIKDDGGSAGGGLDTTTQTLFVFVSPVNDQPFFNFVFGSGVSVIYENAREPFHVATNISSGRCERPKQLLSFVITVLDFCVPDCLGTPLMQDNPRNNTWRLFDGGSNQLFRGPLDSVQMDPVSGMLNATLEPYRNGRVLFQVSLWDGGLSFNRSLTLVVEPINSPPAFQMAADLILLEEDLQSADEYVPRNFTVHTRETVFLAVNAGPFSETSQRLRFGARSVSKTGLVKCLEIVCDKNSGAGAGCHPQPGLDLLFAGVFGPCLSGNATLRVWTRHPTPLLSTYDDEVVQVFLIDDGPMEPSVLSPFGWSGAPPPMNNFSRLFTIRMKRYTLATELVTVLENSDCVSSTPFTSSLSHAKCARHRGEHPFQHIRAGFVIGMPAAQQNVSFFVVPDKPMRSPPSSTTWIFSSSPSIAANGTLMFGLTPGAFGATKFTVWFSDTENKTSRRVSFVLEVININNRPFISLPTRIISFEGESFRYIIGTGVSRDTSGNSLMDWEYDQKLSFTVQASNPEFFAVAPALLERGVYPDHEIVTELSFELVPFVFGKTSLLIAVQDNGGVEHAGVDTTKVSIILEIVAVNQAPQLELLKRIFIFESPAKHTVKNFAFNLVAGPDNEEGKCNKYPGSCQHQTMSLELESLSNPNLFAELPHIDAQGTVYFRSCKFCTGSTSVCYIAVDTGASFASFPDCVACNSKRNTTASCCYAGTEGSRKLGTNQSVPRCSEIHIEPVDDRPGFQLPWDVACTNTDVSSSSKCTCPDQTSITYGRNLSSSSASTEMLLQNSVCEVRKSSESIVTVLESAGLQKIQNFASRISAVATFSPAANAIFGGDDQEQEVSTGKISFRGTRRDALLSMPGLEFASHMQKTSDGVMYFAEPETNSISVWAENGDGAPVFQDRRTTDEVRLRFRGLEDVEPPLMSNEGAAEKGLHGVCSLQKSDSTGDLLAGAGCELLFEGDARENNQAYRLETEWKYIVGDWWFDAGSLYNSDGLERIRANVFKGDQSMDCSGDFCRYRRSRITSVLNPSNPADACTEKYATNIGPAAFRDRSDQMGAAVFVGGSSAGAKCKDLNSEFDTPTEHTLSAVNLIASVGEVEAIRFDDLVSTGLTIADDIDQLVNGNPLTSKLPLEEFTADILFEIGNQLPNIERPLFSAMQRRECKNPNQPSNCGCAKGILIAWTLTPTGEISISAGMSLERASRDPEQYGKRYLQFTGTDVGPGVGIVVYPTWTSSRKFVKGEWVDIGITYDGTYARFYHNSSQVHVEHLCTESCPVDVVTRKVDPTCTCGNILYAAAYHRCPEYCKCPTAECERLKCLCGSNGPSAAMPFKACFQGEDLVIGSEKGAKTSVTLGSGNGGTIGSTLTNAGMIHHIRLFKKALGLDYFTKQKPKYDEVLKYKGSRGESHFFNSNSQGNPGPPLCQPILPPASPSLTFVNLYLADPGQTFKIYGFFECEVCGKCPTFKARFSYTYSHPSKRTVFTETSCFFEAQNAQACQLAKYSDTLTCALPSDLAWTHGYKATILSVIVKDPVLKDETFLVSKACFDITCGYIQKSLRTSTEMKKLASKWAVLSSCCSRNNQAQECTTGNYLYSTAISGAISYVRFVTHSQLVSTSNQSNITLRALVSFEDGLKEEPLSRNYGVFDSIQSPFLGYSSMHFLGVSSIRLVTIDNERFLLVANYWDGKDSRVLSRVMRVDDISSGSAQMTMLQGILTTGATDMQLVKVDGKPFIMVANFEGSSSMYRWRGRSSISYIEILDGGYGYIDGDIRLVCIQGARGDACRKKQLLQEDIDTDRFRAQFRVDNKGRIASVGVTRTFKYMTDVDVGVFYPGTRTSMERTITSIRKLSMTARHNCTGRLRIRSTVGGFEAWADESLQNIRIVKHGSGLDKEPELLAESIDVNETCSCFDALDKQQAWAQCLLLSIPHAGHMCAGGDRNGDFCSGPEDVDTCRGSTQVFESGVCTVPRPDAFGKRSRAQLAIRPLLDPPVRTSRLLLEQPVWQSAPWVSSTTPVDTTQYGKFDLGIMRGASGMACFARGVATYCVFSIFFDPSNSSTTRTNSKVLKISTGPEDAYTQFGPPVIEVVQLLPTNAAYGVTLLSMPYCKSVCKEEMGRQVCKPVCTPQRTLLFIPCQVGDVSPLYLWDEDTSALNLVQSVRTSSALSADSFQYLEPLGTWYVIIGQVAQAASVLRWNGTSLLGANTYETLPKDTAGGSQLKTMLTGRAFRRMSGITEGNPLLLAASYNRSPSQMYRFRGESLEKALLTPVKLALRRTASHTTYLNGSSGEVFVDTIYVACYGGAGISVFEREPRALSSDTKGLMTDVSVLPSVSLYYRDSFAIGSTVNAADQSLTKLSLHGINDLAVQGNFLYTASVLAHGGGCIHVFQISSSGKLTEKSALRMMAAAHSFGLRGVRALTVTNRRLFAASVVDEAVSLFSRDEISGALTYQDHILNGERLTERFPTSISEGGTSAVYNRVSEALRLPAGWEVAKEQAPGESVTWYNGKFPFVMGHGTSWASASFAVKRVSVHGKDLFVVLTANSQASLGTVLVFEYVLDKFIKHSELKHENGILHVEHFSEADSMGIEWHYLILASGQELSSLYRYNPEHDKFFFFNKIPIRMPGGKLLPPQCAWDGVENISSSCNSEVPYVLPNVEERVPPWWANQRTGQSRKAHAFRVQGLLYLAVATWWPRSQDSGYTWFSYVYKWQSQGTTSVTDNTTATAAGFQLFQIIPSSGAIDVLTAQVSDIDKRRPPTTLLYFANNGVDKTGGSVEILAYSRTLYNELTDNLGAFSPVQSLPGNVTAVEAFSVNEQHFLLVATPFNLTLYLSERGQFAMHQELSIASTTLTGQDIRTLVSSLKYFQWQNESYLGIGKSMCSPTTADVCACIEPEAYCRDELNTPSTIIMQWDHARMGFGDIRAVLSTNHAHDAHFHRHHERALRLEAGAVRQIDFAGMSNGVAILLLVSHDNGISCFEWDFEYVVGMHGVVGIAADSSEMTAYAVYSDDASLVAITASEGVNDVRNNGTKVKYLTTWTQAPMRLSRSANTTWEHIDGLAGARGVSVQEKEGCRNGEACNVVVWARPPTDESICSSVFLFPTWEEPLSTVSSSPLPCQQLTFVIAQLSTSNAHLFQVTPTISTNGTLSFLTSPTENGHATYSVRSIDDGMNQGWIKYFNDKEVMAVGPNGDVFNYKTLDNLEVGGGQNLSVAHIFTISVLSVNNPPTFQPIPIYVLKGNLENQTLTFALNVSTGAKDENQSITFAWKWRLRFFVGWDAVNARPGLSDANRQAMEVGSSNVYKKCAAQQLVKNLFASDDRLYDIEQCKLRCEITPGCQFVVFANLLTPCSLAFQCLVINYPDDYQILSGIYQHPAYSIHVLQEPAVHADIGVMSISYGAWATGPFVMSVRLSDDGVDGDGMGSMSMSEELTVTINVLPRNLAPTFNLPPSLTVDINVSNWQTRVSYKSFASGISAGIDECMCRQTQGCSDRTSEGFERAPELCQDVTFSVFSVQTLDGGSRPNFWSNSSANNESVGLSRLFANFRIDSISGDLDLTTSPHWTGRYHVQVLATDNGNSLKSTGNPFEFGHKNSTLKSFFLYIPTINEIPSCTSIGRLTVDETPHANILQRHAYFTNISAGSGNTDLDLTYGVKFQVVSSSCLNSRTGQNNLDFRKISCTTLFSQQPYIDSDGFINFMLHPLANGLANFQVKVFNSGPVQPDARGGFQKYPVEIVIVDYNEPPTCTVASEIVVLSDLGPLRIPNFLINSSVGLNEEWQNLIIIITLRPIDRQIFVGSEGPTVDSSGALLLETSPGSYGTVTLSVVCHDDGVGGSNTSNPILSSLRILPRPELACVSPPVLSEMSNHAAVLTITGQHFGGFESRGYFSDESGYSRHVQVLLGGVPCRTTTFLSDSELLCVGVAAGQGLHNVQVQISDPYFVEKTVESKAKGENGTRGATISWPPTFVNTGTLDYAVARPVFIAGGIDFFAIGFNARAQQTLPAPLPLTYNLSDLETDSGISVAVAKSCDLLVRSICSNGSLLTDELRWRDVGYSLDRNCTSSGNATLGLLEEVYGILSPNNYYDYSKALKSISKYFSDLNLSWPLNSSKSSNTNRTLTSEWLFPSQNITIRRLISDILNCSVTADQSQLPHQHRSAPENLAISTQLVKVSQVNLDGPVRALATIMGRVFVGGGFKKATSSGRKDLTVVNHIFEFSSVGCLGNRESSSSRRARNGRGQRTRSDAGYVYDDLLQPLGGGTDGTVYSMENYQNLIVVGGSFQQVYQREGSPLRSGSLAAWDPLNSDWLLIGQTPHPDATVLQIKSYRNSLYVVGRFRVIGGVVVNNVAVHRGDAASVGGWTGFSTGVVGGHAVCITFVGNEVIVGGNFVRAGETVVNNIARWDGREWQRMTDEECERQCDLTSGPNRFVCQERNCQLDGMVTVLAANGGSIYAAGHFHLAGARPAAGIAQYFRSYAAIFLCF
jgi:hypothetical protein